MEQENENKEKKPYIPPTIEVVDIAHNNKAELLCASGESWGCDDDDYEGEM